MRLFSREFQLPVLLFGSFIVILTAAPDSKQAQVLSPLDTLQSEILADTVNGATVFFPDSLTGRELTSGDGSPFSGDTLYKSPWGAVLRSLVIPGWGQWYNEKKWKVPLYLASDAILIGIYLQRDKSVDRLEKQRSIINRQIKTDPFLSDEKRRILQARFNDLTGDLDGALNRRNLFGWLFAISHLLGMVDAYTDAHLFKFDEKIEMSTIPYGQGYYVSVTWSIR